MKKRRKRDWSVEAAPGGTVRAVFEGHQKEAKRIDIKKLRGSIKVLDMAKIRAKRQRDGHMWIDLSVESLATDKALRSAVAKHLISFVDWPQQPPPRSAGPLRRGCLWNPRKRLPVTATVVIDAYLTSSVPKKLRERTFTLRHEGEALVKAADMYRRVYEENEKLGGERMRNPDVKKRARQQGGLVNRGFEPYVWGHDIGDLVFEAIFVRWLKTKSGKWSCRITFGIGS